MGFCTLGSNCFSPPGSPHTPILQTSKPRPANQGHTKLWQNLLQSLNESKSGPNFKNELDDFLINKKSCAQGVPATWTKDTDFLSDLGLPLPICGPQSPFCKKKALDWVLSRSRCVSVPQTASPRPLPSSRWLEASVLSPGASIRGFFTLVPISQSLRRWLPHFTGGNAEAQREKVTYPRSYSK